MCKLPIIKTMYKMSHCKIKQYNIIDLMIYYSEIRIYIKLPKRFVILKH